MAQGRERVHLTGLLTTLLQRVNRPVKIKVGGYPEDMFENLNEEEKDLYECLICYMILRDPKQCLNGHLFCSSCIDAWTMTGGEERDKCPACRTTGSYRKNTEVERAILRKRVKCYVGKCTWSGSLYKFKDHRHYNHTESDIGGKGDRIELELPGISTVRSPRESNGVRTSRDVERNERDRTRRRQSLPQLQSRFSEERQRLDGLMGLFAHQLERRRRDIESFHHDREQQRVQQLNEVHSIGRRLNHVATDLMHLLNNMSEDSARYRSYIEETSNVEPPSLPRAFHGHVTQSDTIVPLVGESVVTAGRPVGVRHNETPSAISPRVRNLMFRSTGGHSHRNRDAS